MDRLYKIVGLFNNLSILFSYDYISLIIESFIILSFYLTTFPRKTHGVFSLRGIFLPGAGQGAGAREKK